MGGCCVCFLMVPEASSQGSLKKFAPVAPVGSLMEAQDNHFEEMKAQLESKKKSRFRVMRTQAEILAELANVNRYNEPDKEDYVKWANQVMELSLEVGKEAKAKNLDEAKKLMGKIEQVCNDCHDEYQ